MSGSFSPVAGITICLGLICCTPDVQLKPGPRGEYNRAALAKSEKNVAVVELVELYDFGDLKVEIKKFNIGGESGYMFISTGKEGFLGDRCFMSNIPEAVSEYKKFCQMSRAEKEEYLRNIFVSLPKSREHSQ